MWKAKVKLILYALEILASSSLFDLPEKELLLRWVSCKGQIMSSQKSIACLLHRKTHFSFMIVIYSEDIFSYDLSSKLWTETTNCRMIWPVNNPITISLATGSSGALLSSINDLFSSMNEGQLVRTWNLIKHVGKPSSRWFGVSITREKGSDGDEPPTSCCC